MRTLLIVGLIIFISKIALAENEFQGKHYRGRGDVEYLQLLDISRRMFEPDPEFQNMSMLYMPSWNGLVEGPTWDAWWVQNSYGTTYCALPFLREPWITFLQNSQDLWFDQMGDGKRKGAKDWVAPDGCLCDAARPGWIYYRQGDGRIDIHDWGMEFTAAGALMQSELLLIARDDKAIAKYLPKLERCVNFIESRRDPKNDLFLAGPAGNLLAPSYAGWKKPDGTYDKGYLTGLSVTYIALLDRMIEVEKLAKREDVVKEYETRRARAKKGLEKLTTPEGYFIMSMDPDGTKHGVYGAKQHGYFEASPNHDAIALRVVDDAQAKKIYEKIAAIAELRPHAFILPNYPSYDDMYEQPQGLWGYGTWVNGGHWSTCEGRMILGYYRLGKYEDVRRSMHQLMKFARDFRMDNPLTDRGNAVYQPKEKVNLCYDTFAPAAGMMRGLFEYLYDAEGVTLIPHIPDSIEELEQVDPVRFGQKKMYLKVVGRGAISEVKINGKPLKQRESDRVKLRYDDVPADARIIIERGGATGEWNEAVATAHVAKGPEIARMNDFLNRMNAAGLGESYEAKHAELVVATYSTQVMRQELLKNGEIKPLADASRQAAADQSFVDAEKKLRDGFQTVMKSYETSTDEHKRKVLKAWDETKGTGE